MGLAKCLRWKFFPALFFWDIYNRRCQTSPLRHESPKQVPVTELWPFPPITSLWVIIKCGLIGKLQLEWNSSPTTMNGNVIHFCWAPPTKTINIFVCAGQAVLLFCSSASLGSPLIPQCRVHQPSGALGVGGRLWRARHFLCRWNSACAAAYIQNYGHNPTRHRCP